MTRPIEQAEERSSVELISILHADVDRCRTALVESQDLESINDGGPAHGDCAFHARQLFRAAFAYIEAITFSLKATALIHCVNNELDISDPERYFAADVDHYLNEKGEVVEQRAMLRLASNIRFAFALSQRAYGLQPVFEPSQNWWACLVRSIKVRDRLTHPKWPEDVDISGDEIIDLLEACNGFEKTALTCARRI